MSDPLRLVIFDIDGTLLDSQDVIVAAMADAFAHVSQPMPDRAGVLSIVGLSLPEAIRTLLPALSDAENAEVVAAYKRAFLSLRQRMGGEAGAKMYPGARDAVLRLDGRGYLLSAATGKARRGLTHFLDTHGLKHLFLGTQTADDAPSKPHPAMIEQCLSATGVEAENAVIVGDTEFDMAMGRAAGVRRLGVAWGYHPRERILDGGAEDIIESVSEMEGRIHALWEGP